MFQWERGRETAPSPAAWMAVGRAAQRFALALEASARINDDHLKATLAALPEILIPPNPLTPEEKALLLARCHFTDDELKHLRDTGYVKVISSTGETWAITCGMYQYRALREQPRFDCRRGVSCVEGWDLYGVWVPDVPRLDSLVGLKLALQSNQELPIRFACRQGAVCHIEHCSLIRESRTLAKTAIPENF